MIPAYPLFFCRSDGHFNSNKQQLPGPTPTSNTEIYSNINKAAMPPLSKRRRLLKAARERKKQRRMEMNLAPTPETAMPPEAVCPVYSPEESGLRRMAAVTARAGVHVDETSTGGKESKEGSEGKDNVELDGSPSCCCIMTGDAVPLIDKQEVHLSE